MRRKEEIHVGEEAEKHNVDEKMGNMEKTKGGSRERKLSILRKKNLK